MKHYLDSLRKTASIDSFGSIRHVLSQTFQVWQEYYAEKVPIDSTENLTYK